MPLLCDCFPGCWGAHSVNWPSMKIPAARVEEARSVNPYYPEQAVAVRICKDAEVPYGSYVVFGDVLRVETLRMLHSVQQVVGGA